MIVETVTITPKVDLANQVITLDEVTESPDLFNPGELMRKHVMAVIDLKDKAVQDALVQLGWRPPIRGNHNEAWPSRDGIGRARKNDPGTSVAAANNAHHFASSHSGRILAALIDQSLTAKELEGCTGLTVVQIARRTTELQRDGRIGVVQTSDGVGGICDLEREGFRVWQRL